MSNQIQLAFGLRMKQIRLEKKISQEKLAELSNLDRTYINSVENGKRNISLINIHKICVALECSLHEFFKKKIN